MRRESGRHKFPLVELVVEDPGNCPVLEKGGKMIYAHPETLKEASGRICAQALSTLAPAAGELATAVADGRTLYQLELTCPVEGCGAVFGLRLLMGEEARRLSQRVEKADPAAGAATAPEGMRSAASKTGFNQIVASPAATGPFLSRLSPEMIAEVVDASVITKYEEPTVIIRDGQEGTALYIVAEGELEVIGKSDDGEREVVLAPLGKGECAGEMSLLTGQPATATVRTRGSETIVLTVPRDRFEALLSRRPTMHREFSRIIADRLYRMNLHVEAESGRGISGRLSMIGVGDLIQMLHATRRTGQLSVENHTGREAFIGFREGRVTSAVVAGVPGAEGFYELISWKDGRFKFEGGEPVVDRFPGAGVQLDTMALLMEAMRRLDEKGVPR